VEDCDESTLDTEVDTEVIVTVDEEPRAGLEGTDEWLDGCR